MGTITIDKNELKELVRANLIDISKDRNDIKEIMEDILLGRMIKEGRTGKYCSKKEIVDFLDSI
ncbi:MAG TPA: hypothetical protein PLX22_10790 [Spirochaetota bacterium]|nr:hypothetical protein [Spirochaetota bacterium]HQG43237.1 hypothetical protein [Spirochaetota bacterium]